MLDGTNARVIANVIPSAAVRGSRILIKMGDTLCATWTASDAQATSLTWSGFKPY